MDLKHRIVRALLRPIPFKNFLRKRVFETIHKVNFWDSDESISGRGSTMKETTIARKMLKSIIVKYNIRSIADAPCGDFHWMRTLDLNGASYRGYDIVKKIIRENRRSYGKKGVTFTYRDIVTDKIDKADLVICRDCLVHLSNEHAVQALTNFKKSGSKYLLATTAPGLDENEDIVDGMWRRTNLERPPFNLPKPIMIVNERSKDDKLKALGLWDLRSVQKRENGKTPGARTKKRTRVNRQ